MRPSFNNQSFVKLCKKGPPKLRQAFEIPSFRMAGFRDKTLGTGTSALPLAPALDH